MTTRDRKRRPRNAPRPELARQGHEHRPTESRVAAAASRPAQLTEYRWLTFPVYFAFSVGLFAGLYLGIVSAAVDNTWFTLIVFTASAMLMGWALSRLVVRWMVRRNWVRGRRSTQA